MRQQHARLIQAMVAGSNKWVRYTYDTSKFL